MADHRELLKEVLGYEITSQSLGRGAYSKVVLGIEKTTKRKVAIKMTDLKYHRHYYDREVAALANIAPHNGIVRMIAHYEDWKNQIGYLIEEYVRASTLEDYVHEKSQGVGLKEREALAIFEQIVDVIGHVHLSSFTHHDIKPENVLYDPLTEKIKLIDFGLALKMDEDDKVDHCAGSPLYMAPEVMHNVGEHNAIKSDVWSLAIVLFYLLVGDTPYLNINTVEDLLAAVDARRFYMPRFLSSETQALLHIMMQTDPSKRPSTMQLLAHVRQLRKKGSSLSNKAPTLNSLPLAAASLA